MKLGYTIFYVPDVAASLDLFERAFGAQVGPLYQNAAKGFSSRFVTFE